MSKPRDHFQCDPRVNIARGPGQETSSRNRLAQPGNDQPPTVAPFSVPLTMRGYHGAQAR